MITRLQLSLVASLLWVTVSLSPAGIAQTGAASVPVSKLNQAKVTKIIDSNVTNKENESLGEVEDIVFNKDGMVSYAVLSFGGFLGMGEKFFALPWESLARGPNGTFVLNVDKSKLQKAPGFDKSSWPNMADPKWSTEVDHFYGSKSPVDRSWGGKASALTGAVIKNAAGSRLAQVEDVIVDLDHGRATLVIVQTDKSIDPKDCCVAIPWTSMTVVPKDDLFILNATDATLATATTMNKDKWPEFDRPFTSAAYRHFGRDLDRELPVGTAVRATSASTPAAGCCRSSEIIGANCRSDSNEDIGKVTDLVFNPDGGRIAFLVLEMPTSNGGLRAVPWSLCRLVKSGECAMACSLATLKSAPSFSANAWPDFSDRACQENIFSHYGVKGATFIGRAH